MTFMGSRGALAGGTLDVFFPPVPEFPMAVGDGPPEWTTCADLEPDPVLINDPNLYYRMLGFTWPFRGITKRMLREGYLQVGGENNRLATYAFTRLLNTAFRRRYDRLQFGSWVIDHLVREMFLRKAAKEVRRRRDLVGPNADVPTIDDVFEMWGLELDDLSGSGEPATDDDRPLDDQAPWPWGYYLYRSRCRDTERLAAWQLLLLAAAREQGLRTRFAIGFVGRTPMGFARLELQPSRKVVILLQEETDPTTELAARAVGIELNEMKMMITNGSVNR
jgi:hypothetical protein